MLHNSCDIHTHTLFSRHAYSTIAENVAAAADAGLELLGSADHFGNMVFDSPKLRDFQHFINVRVWPRRWKGVLLLRACEADICDLDGRLYGHDMLCRQNLVGMPCKSYTLQDKVFDQLDYVIASVHGKEFAKEATPLEITHMYVGALEQPRVLVLGHAGRPRLKFDVRAVVGCARELGKLIEINNHTFNTADKSAQVLCRKLAEECANQGVGVVVSSDAHICCDIGRTEQALAMLEAIDFPQDLIATRSAKAFMDAAHKAGFMLDLDA